QDCAELAGKSFEPARVTPEIGGQLVVGDDCRYGGDEPERGRKQRLGYAGRYNRETGVLRGGDRLKAVHDAPDRAEQADKGRGRRIRITLSKITAQDQNDASNRISITSLTMASDCKNRPMIERSCEIEPASGKVSMALGCIDVGPLWRLLDDC